MRQILRSMSKNSVNVKKEALDIKVFFLNINSKSPIVCYPTNKPFNKVNIKSNLRIFRQSFAYKKF